MDKAIMAANPKMKKADGTLSLQGYGVRKNMFISFVNQVTLMGKSVIFVAHEREEKVGDEKQIRPEIGGSSAGDLLRNWIWSVIWKLLARIEQSPLIRAKSSTVKIPAIFLHVSKYLSLLMLPVPLRERMIL